MKKSKFILLFVMGILLFFCNTNKIDEIINIPKDFKPQYSIVETEDLSYQYVKRISVRITVPKGLSKPILENNIKHAIKKAYNDQEPKPKVICVFAYELGTNTNDYYTAGKCNFAPFGDWSKADQDVPMDQYDLKFEFYDEYFGKKPKPKKVKVTKETAKEYNVDLNIRKIASRTFVVNAKTNFPDGTILLVSVGRVHYLKGRSSKYSGDLFSKDIRVKNGLISTKIIINDKKWYNEHYSKQKKLGKDLIPDIVKISKKVNFDVLFSPKRQKSEDILRILGKDGEFIKGRGIDKSYSFNTMRVSKEISIAFFI